MLIKLDISLRFSISPYSSVVEHPLSKRKVRSSILRGGMTFFRARRNTHSWRSEFRAWAISGRNACEMDRPMLSRHGGTYERSRHRWMRCYKGRTAWILATHTHKMQDAIMEALSVIIVVIRCTLCPWEALISGCTPSIHPRYLSNVLICNLATAPRPSWDSHVHMDFVYETISCSIKNANRFVNWGNSALYWAAAMRIKHSQNCTNVMVPRDSSTYNRRRMRHRHTHTT